MLPVFIISLYLKMNINIILVVSGAGKILWFIKLRTHRSSMYAHAVHRTHFPSVDSNIEHARTIIMYNESCLEFIQQY